MKIVTGVITAPRSTNYLGATLASLAAGGFLHPVVFADATNNTLGDHDEAGCADAAQLDIQTPDCSNIPNVAHVQTVASPRRLGPYRNWKRALATLVETEPAADACVLFQDDVLVARGLCRWLSSNLWPVDVGRIGVVSLYTAGPHHRATIGWHRLPLALNQTGGVPQYTRAYGALAYLFPTHSARRLLENDPRPENRTKIDMNVGEFCQQHGLDYWMHSPSLCQHTGAVSTLSNFGLTEHRRAREFISDVARFATDQAWTERGRTPSGKGTSNVSVCINQDNREKSVAPDGDALRIVAADRVDGAITVDGEPLKRNSDAACAPVSAVLLNWRRPDNFAQILPSLLRHDFIDEVLVWNNGTDPLDVAALIGPCHLSRIRVIDSPRNICTYGRFRAVRMAAHEIIFTQDDDCLIHNLRTLYERFLSHRSSITAGLSPAHYRAEANRTPWLQLGWGSFFMKSWGDVLNRWIEHYGHDQLLARKADRIFTILYGRHDPQQGQFETLPGPDGRPSDRDAHSLWLRSDHGRLTALAARRALSLKRRHSERSTAEGH